MSALEALGWCGNVLFFSRWIVQWLASEREKKSVAPAGFWWLSLAGTTVLGTYTFLRDEPILLFGFLVNIGIYARNLLLSGAGAKALRSTTVIIVALLAAAVLTLALTTKEWDVTTPGWVIVGALGFLVWNGRWPLQWWYSERQGKSHFPAAFWWFSLAGTVLQLAYTLHLGDFVWTAGYITGPLIQIRNLMLHYRTARASEASSATA